MICLVITSNGIMASPGEPKYFIKDVDLRKFIDNPDIRKRFVSEFGTDATLGIADNEDIVDYNLLPCESDICTNFNIFKKVN